MDKSYEELVAQYGGKMQILCSGLYITKKNSTQTTFIEMGVESDDVSGKTARTEAAQEHWMFEKVSGELTLMRSLLNGDRDHDFLIVPPGHRIIATHKEGIVAVENHRD